MSASLLAVNTSTLRCPGASLEDKIEAAARAGFGGIELWCAEIEAWESAGRTLAGLRRLLDDSGLKVVNLIGFLSWAVDDAAVREEALQDAGRWFVKAAELGAPFLAAPPAGAHRDRLDPRSLPGRYAALCERAASSGVVPLVEYWGIALTLGTIGEALQVAADSGASGARILADIFHTYKGRADYAGFESLNGHNLGLLHLNDVPGPEHSIAHGDLADHHRVYPGDGAAPLCDILNGLAARGFHGPVSVELFNPDYYRTPLHHVAHTAFAKASAVLS